jgi:hypothetical protein
LEDGLDDLKAADAGQIADDIMELDVHSFQSLLHLLHLAGRAHDVVAAQPLVVLQLPDRGGRHKSAAQQTVGVQGGQPLAVGQIGLAPRQVADMAAIDDNHFNPGGFQDGVEVEPVNARGFERHGGHGVGLEVIAQAIHFAGECAEHDRHIAGDGHMEFFAADIYAGSAWINNRQSFHSATLLC